MHTTLQSCICACTQLFNLAYMHAHNSSILRTCMHTTLQSCVHACTQLFNLAYVHAHNSSILRTCMHTTLQSCVHACTQLFIFVSTHVYYNHRSTHEHVHCSCVFLAAVFLCQLVSSLPPVPTKTGQVSDATLVLTKPGCLTWYIFKSSWPARLLSSGLSSVFPTPRPLERGEGEGLGMSNLMGTRLGYEVE